ncbi:phytanoyl-CoA dioxygenase family protein [uncultured Gimesia sp.]|uniref:phytanoyl-CoA dioxygenase family protein n=1 Tax=uncultured Gimesia sp. TaxID=1678688 RepID=UPI00261853D9|nr:phytanoyl-CoA dioxygenase family protein [uncultured Gimesia sp.]
MTAMLFTAEQIAQFEQDGFLVVEDLFSQEEVSLLGQIGRADEAMQQATFSRADGEGGAVKLNIENEAHDDIYGAIARCHRVVDRMEALLGDEVYHYHHKMIQKEARVGGAWAWHQDYGYWYGNGCLFPDMGSCMIAVDRATVENGCLQVLRGSHLMGRIDHGPVGDQTGADPERVEAACERFELVHCTLEPGSAVLFHSNLLHRSDQNKSEHPRWGFICCYNTRHNDPYKESRHPRYTPLAKCDDAEVLKVGRTQWEQIQAHPSV